MNTFNPYQQQPAVPQQLRDGGFVLFQEDQQVYTYPVAPGYIVTFVNFQKGIMYTKACYSQYQQPDIRRFRIVPDEQPQQETNPMDVMRAELQEMKEAIAKLTKEGQTNA